MFWSSLSLPLSALSSRLELRLFDDTRGGGGGGWGHYSGMYASFSADKAPRSHPADPEVGLTSRETNRRNTCAAEGWRLKEDAASKGKRSVRAAFELWWQTFASVTFVFLVSVRFVEPEQKKRKAVTLLENMTLLQSPFY